MNDFNITNDFFEIVSGTPRGRAAYMEAAEDAKEGGVKTLGRLNAFIKSIESVASNEDVRDKRISDSKGNIKAFKGYESIESSFKFLKKHIPDSTTMKQLEIIKKSLEKYQPQYAEAYEKDARLVVYEYESALYILVTGLSMSIASDIDVTEDNGKVKISQKNSANHGVIDKSIADMAEQLSNSGHDKYLEEMIKAQDNAKTAPIREGAYSEARVTDTLDAVNAVIQCGKKVVSFAWNTIVTIKNSLFGIIPLIRSIMYLKYKKKADTILSLDKQMLFIQQNIERLEKIQDMDPEKKATIIKKQKAIIEAYRKKSEKLRAELCDGEREAATEIKKNDSQIASSSPSDDDYVLEMYNGTGFMLKYMEDE